MYIGKEKIFLKKFANEELKIRQIFRSFVSADVDYDGVVSIEEFDGMIEAAAALPRYRPNLDIGYLITCQRTCDGILFLVRYSYISNN